MHALCKEHNTAISFRLRITLWMCYRTTNDIATVREKLFCYPTVLIDITKAFDSLNINLCPGKLKYSQIGEGGCLQNLMGADRVMNSDRKHVMRGITLGPLLFTILTSDLVQQISNCN